MTDNAYEQAVLRILASKKYESVSEDAVRRAVTEAFKREKKPKDAEKRARAALHRLSGAYAQSFPGKKCADLIDQWTPGDDETLFRILSCHVSARERLPVSKTDALYEKIFSVTGTPGSIVDCACGLNPIYLLARGFSVLGFDIYGAAVDCVNRFAHVHNLPGHAQVCDLLSVPPTGRFTVALFMKVLPLLETQRPGYAVSLLGGLSADFCVISFPTRTLTGKNVGMQSHYANWFSETIAPHFPVCAQFTHAAESIFIVRGKNACQSSL